MKNDRDGTRESGRRIGLPVQPPKPGKAMSIFVLVVGLGIMGMGAASYVTESTQLDNSVEVTAEVTDIDVEEAPSRGTTSYAPVVTFQYQFEGAAYTSDRLYPGRSQPQFDDRDAALARASAYTVGESVTAHVDPDAPGRAFLEERRSGKALGTVVAGVLVSLIGGVGLYQARLESGARERRRQEATD
jgi:hypothetical protein